MLTGREPRLKVEPSVGIGRDRGDEVVQTREHAPRLLSLGCADPRGQFVLEILLATPLPYLVRQRHQLILDGRVERTPLPVRTREASESCWYPTIDEESIAIDFVVVAWYLELGWMQRLPMSCIPAP